MPPRITGALQQFPGLGGRIRQAMQRAGHVKLASLAEEIGVSESSLSRWCNGHDISLANAVALADCLEVSLDWLVIGRTAKATCSCQTEGPDDLALPSAESALAIAEFLQAVAKRKPSAARRIAQPNGEAIANGASKR
jgi:transcriptional regulator with XRE-family HTH domain